MTASARGARRVRWEREATGQYVGTRGRAQLYVTREPGPAGRGPKPWRAQVMAPACLVFVRRPFATVLAAQFAAVALARVLLEAAVQRRTKRAVAGRGAAAKQRRR